MALAATSEHLMQKIMLASSGTLVAPPKPPRPMYESITSSLTRCAADPLLLCFNFLMCRSQCRVNFSQPVERNTDGQL